jgi:hypothetical protein
MKKKILGFSLIEMILAGALVAVLGGAVYSSFSQGVRLWRYVADARPRIELDFLMDRLTLDLRNAFQDSASPFSGDSKNIRFFTMTAESGDHSSAAGFGEFSRPVLVIYEYDRDRKQIIKILHEYTGLLTKRKKPPLARKVVMEHVQNVSFSFYQGRDRFGARIWRKNWSEKSNCLPQAVRMTVQLDETMKLRRADQVINVMAGFCGGA